MRIPDRNINYVDFERRRIGLEFENPLTDKNGGILPASALQNLYQYLKTRGWTGEPDAFSNNILAVEKDVGNGRRANLGADTSWSIFELALPPADSLHQAKDWFDAVRADVLPYIKENNLRLLGIGMIPGFFDTNITYRTTKPMYELMPQLHFHRVFQGLCAHQAGVSVRLLEAITAVNELTKVSGLVVALCANASIHRFAALPWKDWRSVAWKLIMLANNPGTRILAGFPDRPFASVAEYLSYFWKPDARAFLAGPVRGGRFTALDDEIGWHTYFHGNAWKGRYLHDEETTFSPEPQDLNTAMLMHWPWAKLHVTFDAEKIALPDFWRAFEADELESYLPGKYTNLYIEYRPAAAAPVGEEMALPALTLGLAENLKELQAFTERFSWEEWKQLPSHAAIAGLSARIGNTSCRDMLEELLAIARRGLVLRGLNEESYLDILFERVENGRCPADDNNEVLRSQGREEFLNHITYTV